MVALVGLLGMVIGAQVIPTGRQLLASITLPFAKTEVVRTHTAGPVDVAPTLYHRCIGEGVPCARKFYRSPAGIQTHRIGADFVRVSPASRGANIDLASRERFAPATQRSAAGRHAIPAVINSHMHSSAAAYDRPTKVQGVTHDFPH
jgi:hypothetical protein